MIRASIVAAVIAATSVGSDRQAVLQALRANHDIDCTQAELNGALANSDFTALGQFGGKRVILTGVRGGACLCGNGANCPFFVLARDGERSETLLSTYATEIRRAGTAKPLPNLIERARDNAETYFETEDIFRDGRYATLHTWIVRADLGARKLVDVPVRFAPGTSSVMLHGSSAQDWYDEYEFSAQRGQQLTVDAIHARDTLTLTLYRGDKAIDLKPGIATTLPASGAYRFHVEAQTDTPHPYSLRLTIR